MLALNAAWAYFSLINVLRLGDFSPLFCSLSEDAEFHEFIFKKGALESVRCLSLHIEEFQLSHKFLLLIY